MGNKPYLMFNKMFNLEFRILFNISNKMLNTTFQNHMTFILKKTPEDHVKNIEKIFLVGVENYLKKYNVNHQMICINFFH